MNNVRLESSSFTINNYKSGKVWYCEYPPSTENLTLKKEDK